MRNDSGKSGMKSLQGGAPLRSRGFLSQPGGQAANTPDNTGKPNKSRGKRQSIVSGNGKPADLATKVSIRPYTLEDE